MNEENIKNAEVEEVEEETEMENTNSGNPLGTLLTVGFGFVLGVVGTKIFKKIKDKRKANKENSVEDESSNDETEDSEESED